MRQNPLIGYIFWNAADLARKLGDFRIYYNEHRVHRSLHGITPEQSASGTSPPIALLDQYEWQSHCRGLFRMPIAA